MKQAQTKGKGQDEGQRSMKCSSCSSMGNQLWSPAALLQVRMTYPAEDQQILPGHCVSDSLSIRRYRRKFAVFPRWR